MDKKTVKVIDKVVKDTREGKFGTFRICLLKTNNGNYQEPDFVWKKSGIEWDSLEVGQTYEIMLTKNEKGYDTVSAIEQVTDIRSDYIPGVTDDRAPAAQSEPTKSNSGLARDIEEAFAVIKTINQAIKMPAQIDHATSEAVCIYEEICNKLGKPNNTDPAIIIALVQEAGLQIRTRMIAFDKHVRKDRY